ncbi:hypothetical protein CK203_062341 [Vitis vinifera]|uniref:Uncharacterized protein n=1 Tax=Vitis vinifera TaxID=29760 RepID=A0A438G5S4_VITVI|nr:hypothetical protein CK203_062341 [Vitis vinifera]
MRAFTIRKPPGNARKCMCGGDDHLAWKHPVSLEACRGLRTAGGSIFWCPVWIRLRGLELEAGGYSRPWPEDRRQQAPPQDGAQYDSTAPPPLHSVTPIQASEDAHARMDRLEQRMRQMRVSDGDISWDDFDGAP